MVDGVPAPPEELVLAAEFPAASREEWVALVDAVMRKAGRIGADAPAGAGVEKLVRRSYDGIPIPAAPHRRRRARDVPAGRARRGLGRPPARHHRRSRRRAGRAGERRVVGVAVDLRPARRRPGRVLLDLAPVVLDTGGADTGAAEVFLALPGDPAVRLGTLGLDPIGLRARTGTGPDVASVVPLARRVAAEFPRVRAVVVDAVPVHTAGGSDAQELGFSLAAGVAYLRALTDAGLDVATAAGLLEFRYAATVEQFATIAKLRAARRLWTRVTAACGDPREQAQHAVASPTMLTRRDPAVNLLRGTVAGFAAGSVGPTPSPSPPSIPRSGRRSRGGSRATPSRCWSWRRTWPAWPTRRAARGTSSRSPRGSRGWPGRSSRSSKARAGPSRRWTPGSSPTASPRCARRASGTSPRGRRRSPG